MRESLLKNNSRYSLACMLQLIRCLAGLHTVVYQGRWACGEGCVFNVCVFNVCVFIMCDQPDTACCLPVLSAHSP